VLGISNGSLDSHNRFTEKINLMFPLISGRKGKPTGLYAGGRMAFLIDKQGIAQMIVKGIPENSDILEKIKQLKK
jgi:peroxiredoxin